MRLAQPGDEKYINGIINHPSVRSLIFTGDEAIDITGCLEDNLILFDDSGIFVAYPIGDGEFVAMSAFLPEHRGLKASVAHRRALDMMFFGFGALRIYATVDDENLPAIRNLEGLGFNVKMESLRIIAHIDYMEWAQKSRECKRVGHRPAMYIWGNDVDQAVSKAFGAFIMGCISGWPGLALRMWHKFSMFNRISPIIIEHETDNVFSVDGKKFEITASGFMGV